MVKALSPRVRKSGAKLGARESHSGAVRDLSAVIDAVKLPLENHGRLLAGHRQSSRGDGGLHETGIPRLAPFQSSRANRRAGNARRLPMHGDTAANGLGVRPKTTTATRPQPPRVRKFPRRAIGSEGEALGQGEVDTSYCDREPLARETSTGSSRKRRLDSSKSWPCGLPSNERSRIKKSDVKTQGSRSSAS